MRILQNLPLFYYPGTWVYVDDDKNLLKCIEIVLKQHANIKTFSSPKICLNFLNRYHASCVEKKYFNRCDQDESFGILRYSPVDFDITSIVRLSEETERHDEVTVIVIDYHMPEMNGFLLSQSITKSPVQKILLTGTDDDSNVITGFNHSYIHRYIQKGDQDMEEKLTDYLYELTLQHFQTLTAPLLAHLEAENPIALSDPVFVEFFKRWCRQNNIREYYLIDKQGSFLGVDNRGEKRCFIVQTDSSINDWMTYCEVENELSDQVVAEIKERIRVPFFGIGKNPWDIEIEEWPSCLFSCDVLVGREKYYWFERKM